VADEHAVLPRLVSTVRLHHDARDDCPVGFRYAEHVAGCDRPGAREARVSGDKIPKDHAEELGDCFAAYARGLFGYACALTRGDHALADDLVQAAFVAAARQWPTMRCLRDAQRLRWLQTTVSNLAITGFRRNRALGDHLPRLEAVSRPPPADTHTEAVSAIALQRCWQTIQALPPQQHAVANPALAVRHDQHRNRGDARHRRRNGRGPPFDRARQADFASPELAPGPQASQRHPGRLWATDHRLPTTGDLAAS
jgi:DNA-directed RNA polymerase specialized sigma24 family protein